MSDATFRAAIEARLLALGPAIGRVHDYERWTVSPSEFLRLFQDMTTKKIFGWEIIRTGLSVRKVSMFKWKMIHRFIVRGYYGLSDKNETEKAVNALVDEIVLDFFRTPLSGSQGEQLPEVQIGIRMFGSVLCHVAEITLPEVAEIVSREPEADETDLTGVGLEYYLKPGDDTADASDTILL